MSSLFKRQRKYWFAAALLAPLLLVLAGCSSLPTDLQTRTDTLSSQLSDAKGVIEANEKEFNSKLKEQRYSFIADYTKEQQHADVFDKASAKLNEAQKSYDERVKPLQDNFDEPKRAELETAFGDTEALLAEANTLAADPLLWLDRVAQTKEQPSAFVEAARKASNAMVADYALLETETLATSQSYPTQVTVIDMAVKPLDDARGSAVDALSTADAELAKANPNYAVLATDLTKIDQLSTSYVEGAKALRADIATLPSSETHTLLDLRVDSFVETSRTSWDEYLDYPDEHDYEFTANLVKPETATYFADRVGEIAGEVTPGWGSSEFRLVSGIDAKYWDDLKIDPMADFPGDDNMAEIYIDAIDDTYCQKIKVLRDGVSDSSGRPDPAANYCSQYDTPSEIADGIYWVDADEFNAEAIGMDIYSKAYGDFASQASTAATPPGMAYVGDPTTGEWREDSNGNSFWHYYGQYLFFNQLIGGPNSYHYRSEYDTWNRGYRYNNQPYYAGTSSTPRYGAHSPQVSSRFAGSAYVGTGLNTATVRNAGPAARAGGPGNGGK